MRHAAFAYHGGDVVVILFVFIYPRETQGEASAVLCHTLEPCVGVQFEVGSAHQTLVYVPVAALLARQGFDGDALSGFYYHATAYEGVVNAEVAVFVGAKYKSRTELLVERARGDINLVVFQAQIGVHKTPTFHIGFEAG